MSEYTPLLVLPHFAYLFILVALCTPPSYSVQCCIEYGVRHLFKVSTFNFSGVQQGIELLGHKVIQFLFFLFFFLPSLSSSLFLRKLLLSTTATWLYSLHHISCISILSSSGLCFVSFCFALVTRAICLFCVAVTEYHRWHDL